MMKVFGGWDAYKRAPLSIVEEQILLWIADQRGQAIVQDEIDNR